MTKEYASSIYDSQQRRPLSPRSSVRYYSLNNRTFSTVTLYTRHRRNLNISAMCYVVGHPLLIKVKESLFFVSTSRGKGCVSVFFFFASFPEEAIFDLVPSMDTFSYVVRYS
jgi:hypothetical protein